MACFYLYYRNFEGYSKHLEPINLMAGLRAGVSLAKTKEA